MYDWEITNERDEENHNKFFHLKTYPHQTLALLGIINSLKSFNQKAKYL